MISDTNRIICPYCRGIELSLYIGGTWIKRIRGRCYSCNRVFFITMEEVVE